MGARCKAQRLRRNIDEIAGWPDLQCHHTHAADEWQPYLQDGQRASPAKRRPSTPPRWLLASQSPLPGGPLAWGWQSSMFPVSASWKPQAGFISPPRVGNGTYSCLPVGLRPTHPEERARTPQRKRVVDVIREDKTLPPRVVYVGRGSWPQLRPVLLASPLCAALGRGPSGVDRMCSGLRLRDGHGL